MPRVPMPRTQGVAHHQVAETTAEAREGQAGNDPVSHPSHYTSGGVETIDVIEAWGLGFHLGNVVKYVSRAGKKDPERTVEDLRKAKWYLERAIDRATDRAAAPSSPDDDTSEQRRPNPVVVRRDQFGRMVRSRAHYFYGSARRYEDDVAAACKGDAAAFDRLQEHAEWERGTYCVDESGYSEGNGAEAPHPTGGDA